MLTTSTNTIMNDTGMNSTWTSTSMNSGDGLTTWPNTTNFGIDTNSTLGTFIPNHQWDYTCPWDTYPWIVQPVTLPLPYPVLVPYVTTVPVQSAFVLRFEGNDAVLTLDVPGVKDGDASITNGLITFTGSRFDTGVQVNQSYWVGHDYDPKTLQAHIEAGVLTVRVTKLGAKKAHTVRVKSKP